MAKTYFPFAFFEDKVVKTENANVSIMTNGLQYGSAVFGGIRGYYNSEKKFVSVFRIRDHYSRFLSALKILGVNIKYNQKQLEGLTVALIKKNKPKTDCYLRPFAYAPSTKLTPNLKQEANFHFALYMIPLADYLPTEKGLSVCVSSFSRISDNAIPSRAKISGGYINSALARKEAEDRGFDEAVFLTEHGHVSEGSAENIFLVRDGALVTPSKSDEILEGITRRTVMTIAGEFGIPVEERSIDRSELYVADEAFFSGTGVQIAWISKIDGREVGTTGKRGPITQRISEEYFKTVRGNNPQYDSWCTKISAK